MTKILTYYGSFNIATLADALLAAFPAIEPLTPDGSSRLYGYPDHVDLLVPDGADETAIQAVIDAHDPAAPSEADQLRETVVAIAQSAAGVPINDLTTVQIKALLAVVIWRVGGIAPDMTIRPLNDWT